MMTSKEPKLIVIKKKIQRVTVECDNFTDCNTDKYDKSCKILDGIAKFLKTNEMEHVEVLCSNGLFLSWDLE